jgi:hypothetical protein
MDGTDAHMDGTDGDHFFHHGVQGGIQLPACILPPSHSYGVQASRRNHKKSGSHFSSSHDYDTESEKICTSSIFLPVYLEHLQVS